MGSNLHGIDALFLVTTKSSPTGRKAGFIHQSGLVSFLNDIYSPEITARADARNGAWQYPQRKNLS
jgi:hypothetical protein